MLWFRVMLQPTTAALLQPDQGLRGKGKRVACEQVLLPASDR